jgi:hypothetical protein
MLLMCLGTGGSSGGRVKFPSYVIHHPGEVVCWHCAFWWRRLFSFCTVLVVMPVTCFELFNDGGHRRFRSTSSLLPHGTSNVEAFVRVQEIQ